MAKNLGDLNVEGYVTPVAQEHGPIAQTGVTVVIEGVNIVHGIWRPPCPDVYVGIKGARNRHPTVHVGIGVLVFG